MRKSNRLINEKSPYLRQHAHNPVDWYTWCEEAFASARGEDKPVFLSIGYSTCHWCHVMEKESFEDEEIAKILNENYIAIKVDREERPDIDSVYMRGCQIITGKGGWPLTIVMTPDKKPFFAGTYFPKESLHRRPRLKNILLKIAELWKEDRDKIEELARKVVTVLEQSEMENSIGGELKEDTIHRGFAELSHTFDETYGGFGSAPKFPIPHNLMFSMSYYARTKNEKAIEMVRKTLTRMRLGGIWDHIGFGFHRYSTDREWRLPHFEKILYDNALLMYTYSEAYQVVKEEIFAQTVEEIGEYLVRDMLAPERAFYSAEDADSEGEEGKFYIWTLKEVNEALSEEEFKIAIKVFGLEEEGNFIEEVTRRKIGRNILYMNKTLGEYAEEFGMKEEILKQKLEEIKKKLLMARERRVRPLRDEKILTDWNVSAIAGFSKADVVFSREDYIEVAERCADFILKEILDQNGTLLHIYKDGEAEILAFLEDYAYLIWGLTELYFASFETEYLRKTIKLADFTVNHFWDNENLGFLKTPDFGEKILVGKKEIYDGALPSGNSVMAYNLLRFSRITGNTEYEKRAYQILGAFSEMISSFPSAHNFSLISLNFMVDGGFELVIVSKDRKKAIAKALEIEKNFIPEGVVLVKDENLEDIAPFIKNLKSLSGETTFYLCRNFTCEEPLTDPEEVIGKIWIGSE